MNRKEVLEKVLRGYDVKAPNVLKNLSFSDVEEIPMKKESLKKKYVTAGIIYAAACVLVLITIPFIVGGGKDPETPIPAASGSENEAPDETVYDLGGEEFVILSDHYTFGLEITDDTSAVEISKVVSERNNNTEEKFGIKLVKEAVNSPTEEVSARAMSGQNDYNAVIAPGYDINTVVYDGYLCDLHEIYTMDFSESCWLPNAVETLTVADRMFFTGGKLTLAPLHCADFLIFNGDLMESMEYTSPYELMDSGEWNYDNFLDMMIDVAEDLDSDGEIGKNDRHGGIKNEVLFDKVCYEPYTIKNEDNTYTFVCYSEKMTASFTNYAEKIYNVEYALYDDTWTTFDYDPSIGHPDIYNMFADDRALFLNFANLRNDGVLAELLNDNCGVVPFPVVSPDDPYVSTVDIRSDMLAVPSNVKDAEMTGRILHYMAGESENTLYAEYFELCTSDTAMGKRSAEMFNIILDSVRYEWAELYVPEVLTYNVRGKILTSGHFESVTKRYAEKLQNEIDMAVEKIKNLKPYVYMAETENIVSKP